MPRWQNKTGSKGCLLGICIYICPSFILDLQPGLRYYKHLLGIVSEENVREEVGVREKDFYRESGNIKFNKGEFETNTKRRNKMNI